MTWTGLVFENYNNLDDPAHPVVAGVPNPFYGDAASHGHFTTLPADAHVIASEQTGLLPTIVEYPLGGGRVIAYGQPLEISHNFGWDAGTIMENTLLWGNIFLPALDVPWLAEAPITGTLARDSSLPVDVTFTAFPTMTVGSVYTASLILRSDDPLNPRAVISVTMNVVEPAYGVEVSADQVGSGRPGEVVTYTVMITNTSNFTADSFTVTLGAYLYDTGLGVGEEPLIVVGPVAMGESATFLVTVRIPQAALDGDHDTVQITVASAGYPTKTAITNITTNVFLPVFINYFPLIAKVAAFVP